MADVRFPWEGVVIPLRLDLLLQRTQQAATGTNGSLSGPLGAICLTIELPWKDNAKGVSCIQAGRYRIDARTSDKHGICLTLLGVPGRGDIEIHRANTALLELLGCIAPVTVLDSPGVGWQSADALARLESLVFPMLALGREVWLEIRDVPKAA